jgi:Tfp pilus assembly protein PilF
MKTNGFVLVLVLCTSCGLQNSSTDKSAQAEFHYKLARNYYSDRNLAMCQRELHTALSLDPNHAEAHHLKGFVLLGLRQFDEAIAEFEETLRIKPDHYEARNNLGAALIALERFEDAIAVLTPLLGEPLYPTPAFAHGNVGYAYYRLKDLDKARQHLEMAVFLNPMFCVGYNNLGQVYEAMGRQEDAIAALTKATKFCPKYAEPYYHLGAIYQALQKLSTASELFQRCAELAEGTPLGNRCQARR